MKLKANVRKQINDRLFDIVKGMQDSIPLTQITNLLNEFGLRMEEAIFCGWEGKANLDIFTNSGEEVDVWLVLNWHKFDTGRYEVVSYIS